MQEDYIDIGTGVNGSIFVRSSWNNLLDFRGTYEGYIYPFGTFLWIICRL